MNSESQQKDKYLSIKAIKSPWKHLLKYEIDISLVNIKSKKRAVKSLKTMREKEHFACQHAITFKLFPIKRDTMWLTWSSRNKSLEH